MNESANELVSRLSISKDAAVLLEHLVREAGLDYSFRRAMDFTGLTYGQVEKARSELKHLGILSMGVGRPGFRLDLAFPPNR